MLKYNEMINKLSDADKVRILCDVGCLSETKYRALGLPTFNVGTLESLMEGCFPSSAALSNSWDVTLVEQVAQAVLQKPEAEALDLVCLPSPKIRINPYRRALSEDPVLATHLSRAYLRAAEKQQKTAALDEFGLHADELEWLDTEPNQRALFEFLFKPYRDATAQIPCGAVITQAALENPQYANVNAHLNNMVLQKRLAADAETFCYRASADQTALQLNRGNLLLKGSAAGLEGALKHYKRLSQGVDNGTVTAEELTLAVAEGRAIAPQTLDEALDRLFTIASGLQHSRVAFGAQPNDALVWQAVERSIVLLQNKGARLPLQSGQRISIIGDIASRVGANGTCLADELGSLLMQTGYSYLGFTKGYDLDQDRGKREIQEALECIKDSEVVLLFLGWNDENSRLSHKHKRLSIPANQQMLLDMLAHHGGMMRQVETQKKKIVAILPAGYTQDIGLAECCSAILMAPINTPFSARALYNVLTGQANPSGKLANTVYLDTEECYVTYKTRRVRDGMGVGPFIGYRYYDTAGEEVAFPFGHGLGYTSFEYHVQQVTSEFVKVSVKNAGRVAGDEIVQVYAGKEESSVLRPQKELVAFGRVSLNPGECKTLQLPIALPTVYDARSNDFVQERGYYTVYVGASSKDIRYTKTIQVDGCELADDGQPLCHYIHSESNIVFDHYQLEAKIKSMKKSVFNFIAGGMLLAMAAIFRVFCAVNDINVGFFDVMTVALACVGTTFLILEAIRRNQIEKEEQAQQDRLNEAAFEDAQEIPVYAANQMFVNEFDIADVAVSEEKNEAIAGVAVDYLQYIDKEQSFECAVADFQLFATERGVKFRTHSVRSLFSALASSRLMIVRGMDNVAFGQLISLVSEYFGFMPAVDMVDASYTCAENVLFLHDAYGNKVKTNFNHAVDQARVMHQKVCPTALTNVTCADLPSYFTPFVNYIKNPTSNQQIKVLNEHNAEISFYVPQNVWFLLNLAPDEKIDDLPPFVSEVATICSFDLDFCEPAEQHTEVRAFSYYQLDWLAERSVSKYSIDEQIWKRVDRFEDYVNARSTFRISNKLWLGMERYAHAYLACGGESAAAVDEALAAKLITPIMTLLRTQPSEEDKNLADVMEGIFGEDAVETSKKIIKACNTGRVS